MLAGSLTLMGFSEWDRDSEREPPLFPPHRWHCSPPGFVRVGGWNALLEGYANAIPSVTVPNSTCGVPRDDAFHLFRDPVHSDLPWPGIIFGMSLPSMWYWCSDQVSSRAAGLDKSLRCSF